jgi:hypothetical protein
MILDCCITVMELLVYPAIYYLWRSRPFKNPPASAAQ